MKTKLMILLLLLSLIIGTATQVAFASDASQLAIPRLVVNTSFLNVHSGPGPQYTVIVVVNGGTELPALGSNASHSWYLVSTAVGQGWVDVSFTLPRGDFSYVPVVDVPSGATAQMQTPITIGLASYAAPGVTTTVQTPLETTMKAVLNVLSVNLRTEPADNGPIIRILFKDDNQDFSILGYAYDDVGVRWIAVSAPGIGAGWIEEAKVVKHEAEDGTTTTTTASAAAAAVPTVGGAHVVINTSYQNVRYGPGPQFGVIVTVPGGTSLEVIGVLSDFSWYKVTGAFGDGWVDSEFVLFRGAFSSVPIIHSIY